MTQTPASGPFALATVPPSSSAPAARGESGCVWQATNSADAARTPMQSRQMREVFILPPCGRCAPNVRNSRAKFHDCAANPGRRPALLLTYARGHAAVIREKENDMSKTFRMMVLL